MFSRWTFLQGIIVIILGTLAFITDYFKREMATSIPSNTVNTVQMLMTLCLSLRSELALRQLFLMELSGSLVEEIKKSFVVKLVNSAGLERGY